MKKLLLVPLFVVFSHQAMANFTTQGKVTHMSNISCNETASECWIILKGTWNTPYPCTNNTYWYAVGSKESVQSMFAMLMTAWTTDQTIVLQQVSGDKCHGVYPKAVYVRFIK